MVYVVKDTNLEVKQAAQQWADDFYGKPQLITHFHKQGIYKIPGWAFRLASQGNRVYIIRMTEDGWLIQE